MSLKWHELNAELDRHCNLARAGVRDIASALEEREDITMSLTETALLSIACSLVAMTLEAERRDRKERGWA